MNTCRLIPILFLSIGMICCRDILKRFNNAVWHDKSEQYAITENMADSCNALSLITRDQSYKRLECVSRIGDDDHFIIAETIHATKVSQYWIINKDKDAIELSANQIVEGPFDLAEFTKREKELGIQDLQFQKLIK